MRKNLSMGSEIDLTSIHSTAGYRWRHTFWRDLSWYGVSEKVIFITLIKQSLVPRNYSFKTWFKNNSISSSACFLGLKVTWFLPDFHLCFHFYDSWIPFLYYSCLSLFIFKVIFIYFFFYKIDFFGFFFFLNKLFWNFLPTCIMDIFSINTQASTGSGSEW